MVGELTVRPISCDDCVFLRSEDHDKCDIEVCTNPEFAQFSRMGRRIPRWADHCRFSPALCGPFASGFKPKPLAPPKPGFWKRLFG